MLRKRKKIKKGHDFSVNIGDKFHVRPVIPEFKDTIYTIHSMTKNGLYKISWIEKETNKIKLSNEYKKETIQDLYKQGRWIKLDKQSGLTQQQP